MMYLVRTAVASLLLAALPTIAWAECAWVVWYSTLPSHGQWVSVSGYPTFTECSQALSQIASNQPPQVKAIRQGSFLTLFKESDKDTPAGVFKCLPDTVRPQ